MMRIALAVVLFTLPIGLCEELCFADQGLPDSIAFYGVLEDGLKEAKATNRPIFLLSAAPQCAGVPGMW